MGSACYGRRSSGLTRCRRLTHGQHTALAPAARDRQTDRRTDETTSLNAPTLFITLVIIKICADWDSQWSGGRQNAMPSLGKRVKHFKKYTTQVYIYADRRTFQFLNIICYRNIDLFKMHLCVYLKILIECHNILICMLPCMVFDVWDWRQSFRSCTAYQCMHDYQQTWAGCIHRYMHFDRKQHYSRNTWMRVSVCILINVRVVCQRVIFHISDCSYLICVRVWSPIRMWTSHADNTSHV